MLVLARKINQSVVIADGLITVTVTRMWGDKVWLGIEAPVDISVHRDEVQNRINREQGSPSVITNINVYLVDKPSNPNLRAFVSFDAGGWRVNGVKVVRVGSKFLVNLHLFDRNAGCEQCDSSISAKDIFCRYCGAQQFDRETLKNANPKPRQPVCHPTTYEATRELRRLVIEAYHAKVAETELAVPAGVAP